MERMATTAFLAVHHCRRVIKIHKHMNEGLKKRREEEGSFAYEEYMSHFACCLPAN